MNTKVFVIIAALLVVSSASVVKADWLDDFTAGTDRLVKAVNENADKVNQLTYNLGTLAKALQQVDIDHDDDEE